MEQDRMQQARSCAGCRGCSKEELKEIGCRWLRGKVRPEEAFSPVELFQQVVPEEADTIQV